MPPDMYAQYKNGDRGTRFRLARIFIRDNPGIAAYHFTRRLDILRRKVLEPKLAIVDY